MRVGGVEGALTARVDCAALCAHDAGLGDELIGTARTAGHATAAPVARGRWGKLVWPVEGGERSQADLGVELAAGGVDDAHDLAFPRAGLGQLFDVAPYDVG